MSVHGRPPVLTGRALTHIDPLELGGKAANLARLERAGVVVPMWIVIPASAPEAELNDPELAEALRATGLDRRLLAVRSSAVGAARSTPSPRTSTTEVSTMAGPASASAAVEASRGVADRPTESPTGCPAERAARASRYRGGSGWCRPRRCPG